MTDEMPVEAVAPCPFCGGPAKRVGEFLNYVECEVCGATGQGCTTAKLAIARWNRRAIPAHYIRAVETLERLRSASKHGEPRGRSSGSDPARVAEEASLPSAHLTAPPARTEEKSE